MANFQNIKVIRRLVFISYFFVFILFFADIFIYTVYHGLPIKRVVISGDISHVDKQRLIEAINNNIYGNLFALNLAQTRRGLSTLPWIETVSVERVFPGTIKVAFQSYIAFAKYNNNRILSTDGYVFFGTTTESLPMIITSQNNGKRDLEKYNFFSNVFNKHNLGIKVMDLSNYGLIVLRLDNNMVFTFYVENYQEQLKRLSQYWDKIVIPPYTKFNFSYKDIMTVAS